MTTNKRNSGDNKPGYKNKRYNEYVFMDGYVIGYAHNTHEEFFIDTDDYDKVKELCWHKSYYGYLESRDRNLNKIIKMHKIILPIKEGENGLEIDHINRNKLDNRKENLRIVTRSINNLNQGPRRDNATGVKGVAYNGSRYVVNFKYNKIKFPVKSFKTIEEAIEFRELLVSEVLEKNENS